MEIRDFALAVVRTEDLDVKLTPPAGELTDEAPGPALRLEEPGRPPALRITRRIDVPPIEGPGRAEAEDGREPPGRGRS